MRKQTVEIYKFSELSESAKEKAIEDYRQFTYDDCWSEEWFDSMKAFADLFGLKIEDYSISVWGHSYVKWKVDCPEIQGLRLRTWVVNNWLPKLWRRKYKGSMFKGEQFDAIPSRHRMLKWTKSKQSGKYYATGRYNLIGGYDEYHLTGYCGDYPLIQPILEFVKSPKLWYELGDLIEDCFDSFIKGWVSDMEYQNSDECITESIECNDYEFYENGEIV